MVRTGTISVALAIAFASPAAAVPHPGAPDCAIFPADNVWHADVSTMPVHPRSGDWLASMGGTTRRLHPDFGPSGLEQPYGIPYNIVAGSHARVNVDFYYPDESDPGPYPLGPDTTIEMGSDHHAMMLDRDGCTLYEIFDASQDAQGWHGGSGAVFDLASNDLRPAGWTSADAAGLSIFAGLIRRDEIAAGVIDHAIRMTASRTDRSYLWPARHHAGAANDPTLPPMGAWFRLKPSFDISGFTAETQIVLRAMRKHGMVVADNGSNWYFGGAAEDGWTDAVLDELKSITAGNFEAVDISSLQVDPNSGRVRTGRQGSLTIRTSLGIGVWGVRFVISGTLTCEGVAVPGAAVAVTRNGAVIGTATTGAEGAWSLADSPSANARYRASWGGNGQCPGGAVSPETSVFVRPGVIVNAADPTLVRGQAALLSGRVLPAHPGRRVLLQRYDGVGRRWVDVTWTSLDATSSYRFGFRRTAPGWLLFRVAYPTQDFDHAWNVGRTIRIDWA
ncbi:MAG: hypothetical protein ACRDJM_04340 [Actinomycetota bacterium]